MRFAADLHIHSRFSRATSRDLDLANLHAWALRKGLSVVGTGDFTHPAWRAELAAQLVPAEEGLFRLKDELRGSIDSELPERCRGGEVRFVLQVEVSTIYKADGATRKVHHVILSPTLEGAEALSVALGEIGNVTSDGRPILGIDSRDLLELTLERCPGGCLIPAHIWTPWFSVLGSKSGFDAVDDCYRDLAEHIFAVETGLSSDPPMNWKVRSLDRFTLVSNSDAHSAAKLARECNLFDTDLSYPAMVGALQTRGSEGFIGTVEFFPEEGKYHLDGHRKCRLRLTPEETRAAKGRCPGCGRLITVGVSHRVAELADREGQGRPEGAAGFESLVGLAEIVGHVLECGPASKKVVDVVEKLYERVGPELRVLRESELDEIEDVAGDLVAEAIRRVRAGEVRWQAGYDGEYGTFEILSESERRTLSNQFSFFGDVEAPKAQPEPRPALRTRVEADWEERAENEPPPVSRNAREESDRDEALPPLLRGLGASQLEAVLLEAEEGAPILVIAGPGTGKTRTLTTRIAHRISTGAIAPSETLALTFTNRAAEEMAERLEAMAGPEASAGITVSTFHAWGLSFLRGHEASRQRIIDDTERRRIVAGAIEVLTGEPATRTVAAKVAEAISLVKAGAGDAVELPQAMEGEVFEQVQRAYEVLLEAADLFDFDDLVLRAAELVEARGESLRGLPKALFVDEYQDLNPTQVRLLRALASAGGSELFVIGDPDQAIYGFRGADPERILRFEDDWPGARVLSLGRSYRSSDTILEAAGQVIARAPGLNRPKLWSGIDGEPHLIVMTASDSRAEAERIALLIERLLGGTGFLSFDSGLLDDEPESQALDLTLSDVAVLYRLRSQGAPIARALGKLGLPVQVVGSQPSVDEAPALAAIVETLERVAGRSKELEADELGELIGEDRRLDRMGALELVEGLESLFYDGNSAAAEQISPLRRVARRVDARWETKKAKSASFVKLGRPVDDLLDWLALHAGLDQGDPRAERISLSTLHAAKGLEWKVVIIAGCEEGLLPYRRPGHPTDLDEERRLFFVGMTRAEQLLVLSRAEERTLYGQTSHNEASPFLLEIEERYKRSEKAPPPKRAKPKAKEEEQIDLF